LRKKAKQQKKDIQRLKNKQDPKSKQELEKVLAEEIVLESDYKVKFTFFLIHHILIHRL